MATTVTHAAIADKIYAVLGSGIIKDFPLFLAGNLAPDAIHAKQDYQREDKKRSHLCDGIRSYGYGYPEIAQLFHDRIDEFIRNYYLPAGTDKDLYLGYVVHLLVDEIYLLTVYENLEEHLKSNGADPDEAGFRKKLANEISNDPQFYNPAYVDFFAEAASIYDIPASEYDFKENILDALEAVWDYEVRDYIGANEINASKRWVINTFFKGESAQSNGNYDRVLKFIDLAAEKMVERIRDITGMS